MDDLDVRPLVWTFSAGVWTVSAYLTHGLWNCREGCTIWRENSACVCIRVRACVCVRMFFSIVMCETGVKTVNGSHLRDFATRRQFLLTLSCPALPVTRQRPCVEATNSHTIYPTPTHTLYHPQSLPRTFVHSFGWKTLTMMSGVNLDLSLSPVMCHSWKHSHSHRHAHIHTKTREGEQNSDAALFLSNGSYWLRGSTSKQM